VISNRTLQLKIFFSSSSGLLHAFSLNGLDEESIQYAKSLPIRLESEQAKIYFSKGEIIIQDKQKDLLLVYSLDFSFSERIKAILENQKLVIQEEKGVKIICFA
jgi:hypothetical protein